MLRTLRKPSALQVHRWLGGGSFSHCRLLARRTLVTPEPAAKGSYSHTPVMVHEVIDSLNIRDDQTFVDLTFGAGGHTSHILSAAQRVRVLALDRDPSAHRQAQEMSRQHPEGHLVPLLGRFSELEPLLEGHGLTPGTLDGALLDCGCSSMQMDDPRRGFGLAHGPGPLDMRMDAHRFPDEPTAADVVNSLDYDSLVRVLKVYGEEKRAKKVAQAIVDSRFMMKTLQTTEELARVVEVALSDTVGHDLLGRPSHPATRTFMALRILVNDELNELHWALGLMRRWLRPGGRLAVISFHSLEDRIVKRHFQGVDANEPVARSIAQRHRNAAVWHSEDEMATERRRHWQPLGPLQLPSAAEVERNPRSRSAKLRVAQRLSLPNDA